MQDVLVQWLVQPQCGSFLTTPYLGLMYYFPAKARQTDRFIHCRLSIVHFWSLIFIYIWADHITCFTALPWLGTSPWVQCFRIMLILPSWGGLLNGLFTLRGAWDKNKRRSVPSFLCSGDMLRYEYLRRSDVVIEECQCHLPLQRLDSGHTYISALWDGAVLWLSVCCIGCSRDYSILNYIPKT